MLEVKCDLNEENWKNCACEKERGCSLHKPVTNTRFYFHEKGNNTPINDL